MDISAMKNGQLMVWVRFDDDVEVLVQHVSRETMSGIFKKASRTKLLPGQRTDTQLDPIMVDVLLGHTAVKDWRGTGKMEGTTGFTNGDEAFPCTAENIEFMMKNHNSFARFINEVCSDVDGLLALQRDQSIKNLSGTCSQDETTPDSTVPTV